MTKREKANRLLDAIGSIRDPLILAAEQPPRKKISFGMRWTAAAACVGLLLAGSTILLRQRSKLPLLPIPDLSQSAVGSGGGLLAKDLSQLVSAPFAVVQDAHSTLPVFANPAVLDWEDMAQGQVKDADKQQMQELLLAQAQRMGLDPDTLNIQDSRDTQRPGYGPATLTAEQNGVQIQVDAWLTCTVTALPQLNLNLPGKPFVQLDPSISSETSSRSAADAAAAALLPFSQQLLGMTDPQSAVTGGDSLIDGTPRYSVSFYDGGNDPLENLLNYHFKRGLVYCVDGEVHLLRYTHYDLSHKMGDYPIRTQEQAQQQLTAGQFLSYDPIDTPTSAQIQRCELTYLTDPTFPVFLPFYAFYVETGVYDPEIPLKEYQICYVPAVAEEYLQTH